MSNKSRILFLFSLFPLISSAQIDTLSAIQIKEVVVIAAPGEIAAKDYPRSISIITSKEIVQSGAVSIGESLEIVSGVDMRQRGPLGVQSDLTIRGGSFEQVVIQADVRLYVWVILG